jgi:hypothetical protein
MFDFNASASDSAPFESIWLSVEWCVSMCVNISRDIDCCIVILKKIDLFRYILHQETWELCLISMIWQLIEHQWSQSYYLFNDVSVCENIWRDILNNLKKYSFDLLTPKINSFEWSVWFQCFSKWFSSFWFNLIPCWMCVSVFVWIYYKEINWVIYCYIILIYLLTSKVEFFESCVWFQGFSKWYSSFWTNIIPCWMMCQCVCVNI